MPIVSLFRLRGRVGRGSHRPLSKRLPPKQAEYWDTCGSSIMVALKVMAARMSGRAPDLGENKKVRVR